MLRLRDPYQVRRNATAGPSPLVVEGVPILHAPELRAQIDLKVFVLAPLDLCLLRRLRRDLVERGRSVSSVLDQYERSVRPMALAYCLPQRRWADRAVSGEAELGSQVGALLEALGEGP